MLGFEQFVKFRGSKGKIPQFFWGLREQKPSWIPHLASKKKNLCFPFWMIRSRDHNCADLLRIWKHFSIYYSCTSVFADFWRFQANFNKKQFFCKQIWRLALGALHCWICQTYCWCWSFPARSEDHIGGNLFSTSILLANPSHWITSNFWFFGWLIINIFC